ncbi:hypothetical protein DespoDRAFT_01638 [Desulfobacter postgatei 2ac9]|uniref:Transcriptional regulator n=2 Tax=Desulfobacter postgatei TaxID=2293 RepID=I5B249_9BACT|nr:hypothetical protein DespoDRAFT_01638 [Desulfobacter postgatei 2ac9]
MKVYGILSLMKNIVQIIIDNNLANRVISVSQLNRLLNGTKQSRYNLVNRAIKKKELFRLHRGLYLLNDRFRDFPCHPFHLAQMLSPGSYISLETALAYHGWIPESVYIIKSVVPGRKSKQVHDKKNGLFTFHPLPVHRLHFLEQVKRYQENKQTMLIAGPLRALMDLVCLRKLSWNGMAWLIEGIRIDPDLLSAVSPKEIQILKLVYKHQRVQRFLDAMHRELGFD